jgi:hypothetical protein
METIILLGIVGAAGYYLKDKTPRSKESLRDIKEGDTIGFPNRQRIKPDVPLNRQPNAPTMYNSNMVNNANDDVLKMSMQNYSSSTFIGPSVTGVLPPIYNSYSVSGTTDFVGNKDPTLKELSDINNVNRLTSILSKPEPRIDIRPMFNVNLQTSQSEDPFSNFGIDKTNEQISLLTGLPYEREHTNAVPFFGGSIKQNVEELQNTSKLDNFTGNTSTFFHKQEIPKFFDNVPEYNINGGTKTPLLTDQIEIDRYVPSLYKQGEKPFYEEKVEAPIAWTEHNPVSEAAGMFPTIEELRVGGDRQQETFAGRLKAGSDPVKTRGRIGEIAKNKLDTSFKLSKERWNTSVGAIVNKKADENYENMMPTTRQSQNIEYYGGEYNSEGLKTKQRIGKAGDNLDNSEEIHLLSMFQEPIRQQLKSDTQRNVKSLLNENTFDYSKKSYKARELERDTTNHNPVSNVNKSNSGQQVYNQDNAKRTIKETTLYKDNSGNIMTIKKGNNTTEIGTDYVFKPTNKETLVENRYKAHASKEDGMGYSVATYRAKTTHGETVSKNKYAGHANDVNKMAENRNRYDNAEIIDTKEKLISGERPSATNSSLNKIHLGAINVSTRENVELKGESNKHMQNLNNISNQIPSIKQLGENTQKFKGRNSEIDKFSTNVEQQKNRFDADLVKQQLHSNPYYNLN